MNEVDGDDNENKYPWYARGGLLVDVILAMIVAGVIITVTVLLLVQKG